MSPHAPTARQRFAARLKESRRKAGFNTARAFARQLGIDENRYARYERAANEPHFALIERICGLLRVTPNELFGV